MTEAEDILKIFNLFAKPYSELFLAENKFTLHMNDQEREKALQSMMAQIQSKIQAKRYNILLIGLYECRLIGNCRHS
jgi:ribosomal protein L20A (L18A)